jgi:uncharacterized repeat protein (TIGR01451 family)
MHTYFTRLKSIREIYSLAKAKSNIVRVIYKLIAISFLLSPFYSVYADQIITNTATASFSINGQVQTKSSSAKLTAHIRTPSTITFLRIDDVGTSSVIPPTSYNNGQSGAKGWQDVTTIKLADGSTIDLPTPQPLVEAGQYKISEPIVIQVEDLDQNTDSTKIDTIFITVEVPGTNDKEILLLRETSPNSGIFRGIIATTHSKTQRQNGQLSLKAGQKITVNYRDEEDSTDTSATAAFVATESANLPLSKTVDKTSATIGELVRYTLKFTNTSDKDLVTLKIQDTLPLGVRYITGSAKLNNVVLFKNKVTNTGRLLQFNLTKMSRGDEWEVEYLTKITAGVSYGKITNKARLSSGSERSNLAQASITIKDDLMHDKAILTGRVYIGCERHKQPKMLENARVYLETGRSVLSDNNGLWHMEGVDAGTHALQLDTDSLPDGYRIMDCGNNTRQAKDKNSQFVDVTAGALWRTDFHVQSNGTHSIKKTNRDTTKAYKTVDPFKLYDKSFLNSTTNNFEILWPKHNFVPEISSTKIVIKSPLQHRVEVLLNGKKVSGLNYDGSNTNKATKTMLRRWKGVDLDIKNRDNTLLVILKDKTGKELARKTHNIHFSGKIASAEFLEDKSVLIADGKTIPTITLKIKDEDGFPMRANSHGYFTLKDSRFQIKTFSDNKDELNINNENNGKYKYHIEADGIAYIRLNPTSQSGEFKIEVELADNKKKEISTWLTPKLRDWILVGLAEGTLAHKTLSGNMQALKATDKDKVFTKNGRLAFFAKGRVKGKYLLTAAYDSHKKSNDINKLQDESNNNIDPDAWYLLYADNSHSQYDAASSSKLYLKIENNKFYALFGDYRSNMTVTELARYERTLHGLKSEYKGDRISYKSFVSITSNKHFHEEIQGDGTSGLYHLNNTILVNSESIKIETRDRFRSEKIIESRVLTRYQDYEIDYDAGTLFFKFPINGRDKGFNPQLIVVDYESESDKNKLIVAGTRIAVKSKNKKLEVGANLIHVSGDGSLNDRILSVDSSYQINPTIKAHVEIAQSKSKLSNHDDINAQVITLEKESASTHAKLFYRRQGKGFGLGTEGSSSSSQAGTEKLGAEINYKINKKVSLQAEISQQKNIDTNTADSENKRQLAEITFKRQEKQFSLTGGLRHSKEQFNSKSVTNNTVIGGASYTTKGGRVTYRADFEQNIDKENSTERSPNRKLVGVDIKIKNGMSLFAEHEITDNKHTNTQNSRVGVTQSVWQGAKVKSTYNHERTGNAQRDYATVGLSQQIKVSKYLSANISVDHAKTLGQSQSQFNPSDVTPQGTNSLRDDYTAFSVGMGSHIKDWSWSGRFEMRDGDLSDKTNLRIGLIHRLKNGREVSAKFNYTDIENDNTSYETNTKLSVGTAWHPSDKDFIFYSRLDLVDQQSNQIKPIANNNKKAFNNSHTQKAIHNMHLNRRISKKTQLSLHHGIKRIIENKNKSTIDTGVLQLRRDIKAKWNAGIKVGYLHDWSEDTFESLAGVSLGMTPIKNAWLEAGYNVDGFDDKDFDENNYSRKGPYVSFRYKFNQDSFKRDLSIQKKHKIKTLLNKKP